MDIAVILYEPEIPPNSGNIIRLSANAGVSLHLVEPMGFSLDEKQLRRAGMDYTELAHVQVYPDLATCLAVVQPKRLFAVTTKGQTRYDQIAYQQGDAFIFGSESKGLPLAVHQSLPTEHSITIPMTAGCRSLNLSNAVAVVVYEAWRQAGFH